MTHDRKERAMREGAFAHYRDPAYYDRIYRRRKQDVQYYADAAQKRGGPVLELGCGSGRVTLAMAKRGARVVGVDALDEMLGAAQAKLAKQPADVRKRVRFVRGDMRSVRLEERFSLVVAPFNVFMHLYTRRDVERALATVAEHLKPRGRLIFDVLMPDLRALLRDPHKLYRCPDLRDPATGRRYHYMESFSHDVARQVQRVSMVFENVQDERDVRVLPLTQRLFYPAEIEALLHYNGFALESLSGDFRGDGVLDREDESQVVVARRVNSRRRSGPHA